METIFFAIGNLNVEKRIQTLLDQEGFQYTVVGAVNHKEAVLNEIPVKRPTVLIMKEGLSGAKPNIFQMAVNIRRNYPGTRIIFIAGDTKEGDSSISNLVAFGIYDIIIGARVQIPDIVKLIIHPNVQSDVMHLLPKKGDIFNADDMKDLGDEINKPRGEINTETTTIINLGGDSGGESEDGEISIGDMPTAPKGGSVLDKLSGLVPTLKQSDKSGKSKKKSSGNEFALDPDDDTPSSGRGCADDGIDEPASVEEILNGSGLTSRDVGESKRGTGSGRRDLGSASRDYDSGRRVIDDDYQDDRFDGGKKRGGLLDFTQSRTRDGRIVSAKQRLVVFYSPKAGIGTTMTALNAACEAANRMKQRILLIEYNPEFSANAYWFDMPNSGYGLEDAILNVGIDYSTVSQAIITKEKMLKNEESDYIDGIKRFPNTLDFLLFSDSFYKKGVKPSFSFQNIEKLISYCLHNLEYDDIYLDISANVSSDIVNNALVASSKNVILLSQDVAIINNAVMFFYGLNRMGHRFDIGLEDDEFDKGGVLYKNIYVVNRLTKTNFGLQKIRDWIHCKYICGIPENGGELLTYINGGYIPLTVSKSQDYKKSLQALGNMIEQN